MPLKRNTPLRRNHKERKHKTRIEKEEARNQQRVYKELDDLWRKVVKKRRGYVCEFCGGPATDAHHQGSRKTAVRWLLDAGVCLCRLCHETKFEKRNPIGIAWFQQHRPGVWETINSLRHTTVQRFDIDLDALKKDFERELSLYE